MRINKETIAKTLPMLAVAVLCTAGTAFGGQTSISKNPNPPAPAQRAQAGGVAAASCGGTELTQNSSFVAAAGTVSCNTGTTTTPAGQNTDNFYARNYPIATPIFVKCVDFAVETNTLAPYSVIVKLYSSPTAGTPVTANLTLLGTQSVSIPTGTTAVVTATFPGSGIFVPAGNLVCELFTPCRETTCTPAGDTGSCFLGSNAAAETGATYIKAPTGTNPGCAINDYTTMTAIGFPNVHILQRLGTFAGNPCAQPLPYCPADMAGPSGPNGVVNVDDLLTVINGWGGTQVPPGTGPRPSGDCAPLPNGNCLVNVDDLLAVINGWGACPPHVGACCYPNGNCLVQTSTACGTGGGLYRGNETSCPPTPVCPVVPVNDECAGRLALPASPATVNNNAATGNTSTPGGACAFNNAPSNFNHDLWYTYTASCTGTLKIDTCATTGAVTDTVLSVYSGNCSALTEIGCDDDGCGTPSLLSRLSVPVVSGTVYRIRVGTWNTSATGDIVLTYSCNIPNDDNCTDATALGAYPATVSNTLATATAETPNPSPCGTPPIQPGLGRWYTCIGNGNTLTATTCASPGGSNIYDMRISVYCGTSCTNLVCVNAVNLDTCNFFQETLSWCSAATQKYWILVWTPSQPDPGTGAYKLDVTSGAVCANPISCINPNADECANATVLVLGNNNLDNSTATTSAGIPGGACAFNGVSNFTRDVWAKYTPTATGPLMITTCNTTSSVTDTVVSVLTGNCSALTEIGCDDDGCGSGGLLSTLTVNVTNGVEIKVRVGSWNTAPVGPIILNLSIPVVSGNDECSGATPVVLGANAVNNTTATTSAGIPGGVCGGTGTFTKDAWYKFTPAATGNYKFSLCSGPAADSVLSVLSSTAGACPPVSELGCDDDACGTVGGLSEIASVPVTAGTTVFVRVGSWQNSASFTGTLTISVAAPSCTLTCPGGSVNEGEACLADGTVADTTNGGCNSTPNVFGTITVNGPVICGTSSTYINSTGGASRDTDWYKLTVAATTNVTLHCKSELPLNFVIFNWTGACPVGTVVVSAVNTANCLDQTISASLPAGTYIVLTSPTTFAGSPCGGNNDYQINVTSP